VEGDVLDTQGLCLIQIVAVFWASAAPERERRPA
jgi:hypothetical protein